MPARSVCLVTLSLSEAGPGRFGGQVSVTDIYHAIPYHPLFFSLFFSLFFFLFFRQDAAPPFFLGCSVSLARLLSQFS